MKEYYICSKNLAKKMPKIWSRVMINEKDLTVIKKTNDVIAVNRTERKNNVKDKVTK